MNRRKMSLRIGIVAAVFGVSLVISPNFVSVSPTLFSSGDVVTSVQAKGIPRAMRGQIITAAKRLPTTAKSERAYYQKIRKSKVTRFQEDKKKKQWKVYFAAFFRRPLNDLEITIKMYDVTTGKRHLINSFEQYTDGRGQTSLTSYVKLTREFFGVNKKILMVMESRKQVLAQGTFFIIGEAVKYSGKVDFTSGE